MPHLLWCCTETEDIRQRSGLRRPRDKCEERLLCEVLPPYPPPLLQTDTQPLLKPAFRSWMEKAVQQAVILGRLFLASDGGAKHGSSSWAAATKNDSYGELVEGEGSSSLTAELTPLMQVVLALLDVAAIGRASLPVLVVVVIDCAAAITLSERDVLPDSRPKSTKELVTSEDLQKSPCLGSVTRPSGCEVGTRCEDW
jgi:hypothetical protein